jgi:RNA polymerase sigma-70 factor (ECF subfamily)
VGTALGLLCPWPLSWEGKNRMKEGSSNRSVPVADDDLVAAILDGDEGAFETLYERYFSRIYRFVDRRMRNRADTEEVTQEVFVNLFLSLSGFRHEAPFVAWVFGVTRRTIAARFKKKRHETVTLSEDDAEQARRLSVAAVQREPDPHEVYECNERIGRMQDAARSSLSDEQQRLFLLHHIQNHSIQEIARRVAKSEDAVKSHLYRARKVLLAR